MRVLMLMAKEVEARARRAATTLTEAGHQVRLLVRDAWDPHHRVDLPIAELYRVGMGPPVPKRLSRLSTLPVPLNPVWVAAFLRALADFRPHLIHVHDLPLVLLATGLGGKRPVIFDLHENYPAMVRTWSGRGAFHNLLLRLHAFERWERVALAAADHCLVVCEEQAARLRALGVAEDRITIVGNTPDLSEWTPGTSEGSIPGIRPEDLVIFYSGYLNPLRGVDRLVEAMPAVVERHPRARLVVAGDGEVLPSLRARARELGVADACHFLGWLSPERLQAATRRANLCAIPHRRSEHTDTTYPNKLLEYLALGKAVVASDCPPMRRILSEHPQGEAGLVVEDGGWADALSRLLSEAELRRRLGERGRELVQSRYYAGRDQARLLGVYERLAPRS